MTDQDVRDMLAERAGSIRPSADGLDRIEAKLASAPAKAARRPPMALLAAAAVVVIALVGAALFIGRDDATNVESGPVATAPPAAEVPPGVWPWPGDDVDRAMLAEAEDAARVYVESRVGFPVENGFVQADGDDRTVTFSTGVSTVVTLRKGDAGWYVLGAMSDLLAVTMREDGTLDYGTRAAGELTVTTEALEGDPMTMGPTQVERGPKAALATFAVGGEPSVTRHWFRLVTADTTGLAEVLVDHRPATGTTTTSTTAPATTNLPAGVWPFPQDDVDASLLDDPVETARAYIDARVGGITDRTTVSEYQAGDNSSGEVTFGGDIVTTVFVRRLDGRWHVEGSASDYVTLHDDDGDGSLTARVEAKGFLQSFVALSTGSSQPLLDAAEYEAGTEITDGLAFDLNSDQVVKAVRFLLTSGPEGTKGLTEVAFRPPFADATVPADALSDVGTSDAVDTVVHYLNDRLGERAANLDDFGFTDLGNGRGEVTWQAGVVRVQQLDGYWYVVEAIGDSVQLNSATFDGTTVRGEITVAEAGVLHISTNDADASITVEQNGEGTVVPFELPSSLTGGPVRVVFETETGFVSLAERVFG